MGREGGWYLTSLGHRRINGLLATTKCEVRHPSYFEHHPRDVFGEHVWITPFWEDRVANSLVTSGPTGSCSSRTGLTLKEHASHWIFIFTFRSWTQQEFERCVSPGEVELARPRYNEKGCEADETRR